MENEKENVGTQPGESTQPKQDETPKQTSEQTTTNTQPRQRQRFTRWTNANEHGEYQPRREGYRQGYKSNYTYRPSYQRADRPYRPHYQDNAQVASSDNANADVNQSADQRQNNYRSNYGYRPNNYRFRQDNYQPRDNYQQRDNYQPRDHYQARQGGDYRQDGGYQPRGHYQQRPGFKKDGFNRPRRPFRQHTDDYDPSAKYNVQKVLRYKEANVDPDTPIRLNRYLANAGVCSRREADTHIQAGDVTVNGEIITELGHKVLRSDQVTFKGNPVSLEDKVYILLNKPKDYVTTSDDPENRKTVMDLVKNACPERVYPVGRLDRNTTGVLLLTNDGEMAAKMLHPKFLKKKIYHVYCNKSVSFADMQKIMSGIMLEDGEIRADRVEYASETDRKQIGIEIHSGKNRIVRRIFEKLGYKVVKLDRVYFAGLTKKNLRRGQWRFLEEPEVNILRMGAYE